MRALCRKHDLSAYDAVYLAMAMRLLLPLATIDGRLIAASTAEGVTPRKLERFRRVGTFGSHNQCQQGCERHDTEMAIYPKAFPLPTAEFAEHILVEVPLQAEKFMAETVREGRAWTLSVKIVLERLGKKHDFRSIYTDSSNGMQEFMLDFLWWSEWGAMLACECEWGYAGSHQDRVFAVAEDFDKLLSFKAPVRLMIFSSDAVAAHRANCVGAFDKCLSAYPCHIAGEKYLLIDFCKTPQAWSTTISKDGLDESLRFKALG